MVGITICIGLIAGCCFFSSGYIFHKLNNHAHTETDICASAVSSFMVGVFLIGLCIVLNNHHNNHPTALDVYEGKTELEYTIINNEVTDSTVVFKNK